MMSDPLQPTPSGRDRDRELRERFARGRRDRLAALVTDSLIEEHRRRPLGDHSPALQVVLTAMRQQPVAGKLALYETEAGREWAIVRLSGDQAVAHDLSGTERFSTHDEALHAVFLRRLQEWGLVGPGR